MFPQTALIFLLGLCFGSFINVLVDRLHSGESFVFGKSHCDKCKKDLVLFDLIPLLSFVFLKGKCRYCKNRLSFYYPFSELITSVIFISTYLYVVKTFGISLIDIAYYLFMSIAFIAILLSDLKYGIIPDRITYPAAMVVLFFNLLTPSGLHLPFYNYFLSAVGAFLFFLILILATKGKGMGIGDLKLVVLLGLFLGFPKIILALYLAFLTGAAVGIILILWRIKKIRGSTIPFGPFLISSAILALFFSDSLVDIIFSKLF